MSNSSWRLDSEQADLLLLLGKVCVYMYVFPSLHPQQNQPKPVCQVFFLSLALMWFQKLTAQPLFACQMLQGICGV